MRSITTATDLHDKYVIVRASLNVPISDGKVTDRYRIDQCLPTLQFLQEAGAKVIVIGHIGREIEDSLRPVFELMTETLPITWGGKLGTEMFNSAHYSLQPGQLLMAENLRQDPREKANDQEFTDIVAAYGKVYVNDAFSVIHRDHMSMVGLPKLMEAYAGMNLVKEIETLETVMNPVSPSLFMLGGAKFETKLPLIEKYIDTYDHIFVGGALANDLFKARGFEVGKSLLSEVKFDTSFLENPKILIPIDVEVEGPDGRRVCLPNEVTPEEIIYDAGPDTVAMLASYIKEAKTILWNGPFGNFEKNFGEATEGTAKLVADSDAHSVVGGGDTVAAIGQLGLMDQFGFVSTGGGAMLTYLEHGTTPALEALE